MKKLLIIEDDTLTQQLYMVYFRKSGIDPYITDNGEELFTILQKENIGLILMDINLTNTYFRGEKMDGIKLSRLIKSNSETKSIPIIIATGFSAFNQNDSLVKQTQADELIVKPITNFKSFIQKVNQYLVH
ncbi:CheY-like receiver [Ignavibacterium album JCM 16511]|uniref:CheY-like receiver n=1 Tax=Ignavibacterium album (strain DSM 19864 / JCM 16511 / NBRC 101810 / Mat9-16) TaxID=945713 RepID=I0AMJ6_IGNAJ|nr:response regulator [Ignavibacterium album]AFH50203.1 CheY-like receiver [Ignavibacterium album JCM 16511]